MATKYVYSFLSILALSLHCRINAEGFSCDKSATLIETIICSEQGLLNYDKQLNTAYSKALQTSVNKEALRSSQLKWLNEERDACKTKDCISESYKSRIKILAVFASPFYGSWNVTWDCKGVTDKYYKERCREGIKDSFSLALAQSGVYICGYHGSVYRLGDRIDVSDNEGGPSITGTVEGKVATAKFASGYSETTGMARIVVKGKKLFWHITKDADGEHYLPNKAVLTRIKDEDDYKVTECIKNLTSGSTGSLLAP